MARLDDRRQRDGVRRHPSRPRLHFHRSVRAAHKGLGLVRQRHRLRMGACGVGICRRRVPAQGDQLGPERERRDYGAVRQGQLRVRQRAVVHVTAHDRDRRTLRLSRRAAARDRREPPDDDHRHRISSRSARHARSHARHYALLRRRPRRWTRELRILHGSSIAAPAVEQHPGECLGTKRRAGRVASGVVRLSPGDHSRDRAGVGRGAMDGRRRRAGEEQPGMGLPAAGRSVAHGRSDDARHRRRRSAGPRDQPRRESRQPAQRVRGEVGAQ